MDNLPEKEIKQPQPETVRLNQKFPLFKPGINLPTLVGGIKQELGPIAILEEPNVIPLMPISIFLRGLNFHYESVASITPLNPNEGYRFTKEDLDPIKRAIKNDGKRGFVDNPASFFYLSVGASFIKKNSDLFRVVNGKNFFKEELLEVLRKIRVQLSFPNGLYEAEPGTDSLENSGELLFYSFYPMDMGPLSRAPEDYGKIGSQYLRKGHELRLPKDSKELSKIEARFFLADQEPVEMEG